MWKRRKSGFGKVSCIRPGNTRLAKRARRDLETGILITPLKRWEGRSCVAYFLQVLRLQRPLWVKYRRKNSWLKASSKDSWLFILLKVICILLDSKFIVMCSHVAFLISFLIWNSSKLISGVGKDGECHLDWLLQTNESSVSVFFWRAIAN